MARFSDGLVPEVVQVFWATIACGEFATAAAAARTAGTSLIETGPPIEGNRHRAPAPMIWPANRRNAAATCSEHRQRPAR